MLKLGDINILKVYIGNSPAQSGYLGDVKIWGQSDYGYKAKLTLSDGAEVEIPKTATTDATITDTDFDYDDIVSAVVYNGVTTIGNDAFGGSLITAITLPNTLTTITDGAFQNCSKLSSITLTNSVTTIGENAFQWCPFTSITIPASVTSIGQSAFDNCSGLTGVTVNATTPAALGANAFRNTNNCPIYVPCASVDAYKSAWSAYVSRIQCKLVKAKLTLRYGEEAELASSGATDITLTRNEMTPYSSNLINIEIMPGVEVIDTSAFQDCTLLTSATIPASVKNIKDGAFRSSLSDVTIEGTTPATLGGEEYYYQSPFEGSYPIYVPCDYVDVYKTAERWSEYADRIKCFYGYKAYIKRRDGLTTKIPKESPDDTTLGQLTNVQMLWNIGTDAEILDGVTTLDGTFYGFEKLSSVTIPYTVTTLKENSGYNNEGVFERCYALSSVTLPTSITGTSLGKRTFKGSKISSITIPDSVTTIEKETFYGCRSLTSIELSESITGISCDGTFSGCTALTSVTVNAITPPSIIDVGTITMFNDTNDCPIYVPAASVNAYKAASGWINYRNRIQAIP